MLRIICNKKIDLTDDEWVMFNQICDSYKEYGGETLFEDLFETDDKGIIKFLRPPSKRQTSLEIFLYVVAIFNHQHIRNMYSQIEDLSFQIKEKLANLK